MEGLISLDIETTTSSPETGKILSIGMVDYESGLEGYWQIYPEGPAIPLDPKSMEVNKIDLLTWEGQSEVEVSLAMRVWLNRLSFSGHFLPLGLNVASFDIAFMRQHLIRSLMSRFSYRALELNAVIFATAMRTGQDFQDCKSRLTRKTKEIVSTIKPDLYQHHALYDCYMNCVMLDLLIEKRKSRYLEGFDNLW